MVLQYWIAIIACDKKDILQKINIEHQNLPIFDMVKREIHSERIPRKATVHMAMDWIVYPLIEIRALQDAMLSLKTKKACIVTIEESEEIETGTGTIHVLPAWKFLLFENLC